VPQLRLFERVLVMRDPIAYNNVLYKPNLAYQRKRCGLSQEGLALECMVPQHRISEYENGHHIPTMAVAWRIVTALQRRGGGKRINFEDVWPPTPDFPYHEARGREELRRERRTRAAA